MLDKTSGEVLDKELGVGIQFTVSVGQGRQIAMTAGIPLDWEPDKVNGILDKLAQAMDRQALRYQLHDMKLGLEKTERDLETNRQQLGNYEQQAMGEWERTGRKGPFRASESQSKQMQNFRNNEAHLIEHIKKMRADIKNVEEQCR